MNVALFGRPGRWAMTERRPGRVHRDAQSLSIGPSAMHWDGTTLTVDIDEVTAPIPQRIRGTVRLRPDAIGDRAFIIDGDGRHRWRPIAPCSRVEVALDSPGLYWSGPAYFDTNDGDAPLERDFQSWDWCRAPTPEGTAILYNSRRRDGSAQSLALRARRDGPIEAIEPPPEARLPRSLWGIARPTRCEAGATPRVVKTLQDAPFYARSVIATKLLGQETVAVHESLDCDRFAALPIQAMLPFRVPRSPF